MSERRDTTSAWSSGTCDRLPNAAGTSRPQRRSTAMAPWFWYAVVAALLYGAHQIFTRLASARIGDGLGSLVVEGVATLTILAYLAVLWFGKRWDQTATMAGVGYSALTGVCVGAGTVAFF